MLIIQNVDDKAASEAGKIVVEDTSIVTFADLLNSAKMTDVNTGYVTSDYSEELRLHKAHTQAQQQQSSHSSSSSPFGPAHQFLFDDFFTRVEPRWHHMQSQAVSPLRELSTMMFEMQVIRPIKRGEELFVSYGSFSNSHCLGEYQCTR